MHGWKRPASLTRGARIDLLAPSSPFDRARFDAGAALLREHYQLAPGASLFDRVGYFAGADEARLTDLRRALESADSRAIVAARGGYGATRLLPQLEVRAIQRANKWLVGFSDVTALHALWTRARVCSIHGPMVCSLAEASPSVQAAWHGLLSGEQPAPLYKLRTIHPGKASGLLFAGNLTVLSALVGTPYFPPLDGMVLALEDIAERPYRLDRMLTTMLQAGVLRGVRALLLGQFTGCAPGDDGVTALDVLHERLAELHVPIVGDAPFGHVAENTPLLLGSHAEVDADSGTVTFALP